MATSRSTSVALAAVVAMGLGTASVPALATPAESFQVAQAEPFADEKLEAFVVAMLEVDEIRLSYMEAVAEADNEQTRAGLIETAQQEMVQAIEETPGITVDEYTEIANTAQTDPEFAGRLSRMLEAEVRE